MKSLSKDIESRRQQVIAALASAENEIDEAINRYNADLDHHRTEIQASIDQYNEAIEDAKTLAVDATQEVQDYFDGKSEKWQDGKQGQLYQEWIDGFDTLYLEEVSLDLPVELEEVDHDVKVSLETGWPDSLPE